MAVTLGTLNRDITGSRVQINTVVTGDNNYVPGGYSIPGSRFGISSPEFVDASSNNSGFLPLVSTSNGNVVLQVFRPETGGIPGPGQEVPPGTDLSLQSFNLVVRGT